MPKEPKRFVIEVTDKLHAEVKQRAKEKNITLRVWVLRAIMQAIKQEEQYQ